MVAGRDCPYGWSNLFQSFLRCFPSLGPVSRFLVVCALPLIAPSLALAQADAPPRNYLDLGPHFVIAPGFGVITEYRDLLLQKAASARIGATATYRGWSFSGVMDQSLKSSSTRASEFGATYSHKLPVVDLHLGIVHADVDGPFADKCTAASLGMSTNALDSTKIDFAVQSDFSADCRAATFGIAREIWKRGAQQIDVKASANSWKTDSLSTSGWSIRAIGRWQIDVRESIHYHAGYISSKLEQGTRRSRPEGAALGFNYVWEFR